MPRPVRIDSTGRWFHVVNRRAARQAVFLDDRDRVEFERHLGRAHARFGTTIHAYAWMTNHYHLLVECPDGHLTEAMHLVSSRYVRHFNDRHRRDGPLFRDRFFARLVDSDAYVVQLARYIHRNPLSIVAPADLIGYRWSSLRSYLGHRRPPPWLRTDAILELVGSRRAMLDLVLGTGLHDESSLDAATLLGLVHVIADEHADELGGRQERRIATLLLDRLSEPARSRVADQLAFPSGRAEAMARLRARRLVDADPRWGRVVDEVLVAAA